MKNYRTQEKRCETCRHMRYEEDTCCIYCGLVYDPKMWWKSMVDILGICDLYEKLSQ